MFARAIKLPKSHSFFLFGPRGTGKTLLLKKRYASNTLYVDLLDLENETRYQLDPESLYGEISALPQAIRTVIIDEIQKAPKLLDVVHRKIEEGKLRFILTGSSARKLKRGGANLLAGRAFVFNLYPLTVLEIGEKFKLSQALSFGTLPSVLNFKSDLERRRYLKAYAHTYLKEEVWGEQLIRKIEPFRRFLPVAAQCHGQPINFSKIARDVGVDDSTVRSYYSILEDTLIGFFLPAYAGSERKQLKMTPKFYLFDNGVKRALEGVVDYDLVGGSFEYGVQFEQLIIAEITRRLAYLEQSSNFFYLATEGGAEVDLVISRGRKVTSLIEIKSGKRVVSADLRHLKSLQNKFNNVESFCLYDGTTAFVEEGIRVLPWREGIAEIVKPVG